MVPAKSLAGIFRGKASLAPADGQLVARVRRAKTKQIKEEARA
jgi:hypothetical protein